jgi:hypothetical protein
MCTVPSYPQYLEAAAAARRAPVFHRTPGGGRHLS